ncbi:Phage holin protein (Holin_LLH) [Chlamydia trachomatis]|nr:Phage holin protein (Holin_LLH) [Chlamydia trachomatis]
MAVDNDNHVDKYDMAKRRVISELSKYNITLSESQLETFIESAVKQMNDSWKGEVHDTSK